MQIELEAEIKSIGFKPVRKNKSELVITIVTESFNPGQEYAELLNKNGKIVKVVFLDSAGEDAVDGMNPAKRDTY